VAIGRALIRIVGIFLMDEPLSNLDAKQRVTMRSEITTIHRDTGATTIYVTHDQTEAMTMGSRIVIMKDGIVQQTDTPQNNYDYPENKFVAGFIGSPQMNFLKAKLEKASQGYTVSLLGTKIPLNQDQNEALQKKGVGSQDIILGVRPEHTTVLFDQAENAIECTIKVNEMMVSELHLHLSSRQDDKIIVRLPTVDLTKSQRDSLSYGSKMYITFPAKVMHLFDPETERSLIDG
jgi:multiple sugar transport system ATP-binding protein